MENKKEKKLQYRHELKYDIGISEYLQLVPRLQAVMKRDPNVGEQGLYRIQSVYCDNYKDKALQEKINGIQKREKFRIRWYNDDLSLIKLEKKMKINNLCLKCSASLTEKEFSQIMNGDIGWMRTHDNQLIQEFYFKEKSQLIRPRVMVSYTREPFIYGPGNVRITFDSDIRTSLYHPFSEGIESTLVDARMEPGHIILEVKYDAFLPDVIANILQMGNIRQSAFSKYGICRRFG